MTEQQKQIQNKVQQVQQKKTDMREILTTFVTEGIKVVATSGMSLGASVGQASIKGVMKQGIKSATKQGLKRTVTKVGKVAGQAAMGTAQKLDNQDDNNMELAEVGMAILNRGRGLG